jgi:hypothetical protein
VSVEAMAAVLHHADVHGTDKVVLLGIANHEGDGGAFPSVATLAKYARVSTRAVQHSLVRLSKVGYIAIDYRRGARSEDDPRYRTNRYEVLVRCPDDCDGSTHHRSRGEASVTPDDPEVKSSASRGEVQRASGVKPTSPKSSLEPSKNRPRTLPRADDFVAWYSAYPKHVARGDAEKAWKTLASELPSLSDLLLATKNYANSREVERGFVKLPATWLRAKCWLDEHEPQQAVSEW